MRKLPGALAGQLGYPWSSYEQLMTGKCPKCYIPNFKEIGPLVPEEKIFEGFFYHI